MIPGQPPSTTIIQSPAESGTIRNDAVSMEMKLSVMRSHEVVLARLGGFAGLLPANLPFEVRQACSVPRSHLSVMTKI